MIWVRWFPGDYYRDTKHLSWLEDCAYRRLLDEIYTTGRALPADRAQLYRRINATTEDEKVAVEHVLSEFFFERNQKLFNSRASKELRNAGEYIQRQVNAGRARAKQAAAAQPRLSGGSASTSTSTTTTTKTPLPPTNVGASPLKVLHVPPRNGLQYIERWGQTIEVNMGRHTRSLNLGDKTAGMSNDQFVDHLTSKGYPARILPAKDPE